MIGGCDRVKDENIYEPDKNLKQMAPFGGW